MANYPGIPAVTDDRDLGATVRALIEAVELLTGQRQGGKLKVATQEDMTTLAARVKALENYNVAHP